MKAFIAGDIYSDKEDLAQFDPGISGAFDFIKISQGEAVLTLYLTRKQVKRLLRDMLQETDLLMVAEHSIKAKALDLQEVS